ncbi:phosphatidic acid phosphatase type 2/haloperoxidase [Choanephora cucurbitarum]|nr:phosphatidic acid phosphatase type 2/haloperoxidase [Choanephora cucurbitarum]
MLNIHLSKSLRTRLIISYGRDWVLVIAMIIIFFAIDMIDPFHREFSINDTSLMHDYRVNESVPVWLLAVIAILVPIVAIACISIGIRRSWMDFNSALLGLALALSMTIMVTDVLKTTVGRPRPDMLSRCQPPPDIQDPPLGLLNYTICTADHHSYKFRDGFKSFPSGHASFSFAGLGYLSFYLAGKMHLFDQMGHTYKGFVFFFPFLGALLIAISRLRDYRHHWTDVFIGGIIGTVFAYFSYRQYYPSLAHEESHKPFAPRISSPEDLFPQENYDEESAVVHPEDPIYGEYTERPSTVHPLPSAHSRRDSPPNKYNVSHLEQSRGSTTSTDSTSVQPLPPSQHH